MSFSYVEDLSPKRNEVHLFIQPVIAISINLNIFKNTKINKINIYEWTLKW